MTLRENNMVKHEITALLWVAIIHTIFIFSGPYLPVKSPKVYFKVVLDFVYQAARSE